ncbi:MAG: peptidylprolyl isomerase [Pseudomonadota bacterium]
MKKTPRSTVALSGLTALILGLTMLATPPAAAQTAFAPAAVVNDDIITYYDVRQRAGILLLNGGQDGPQTNTAALESLIDDRLRTQAAERFRIAVDDDEVKAGLDEFAQRFSVDGAGLVAKARGGGVDETALMDLVRAQVAWRELINGRFSGRATPTEIELDQEIALAAAGRTRSFRLAEIALGTGEGREARAREVMNGIVSELRAGADFGALARRFSGTPSAQSGGVVGWVPETSMPPDLAEIIASTPPGSITQPYEVPGGLSIYRVIDVREEAPEWARNAQVSLRKISIDGDDEDAMAEAKAIRDNADGCDSIPDLSDQAVMESIDTKLVNALPGPVRGAVQLLQAGQASAPLRTDEGRVEVFVVCDRSGGVDAEMRSRLRDQIRGRRLARFAEGYIQELRRDAVIERR